MTPPSAVIVTWNSGATIDRCLESCSGLSVTVVDNASTDDTVQRVLRHPGVDLIQNHENRGFAAAANQGIARGISESILLLNPDIELLTSVTPLSESCADPDTAMAAGRLVDANGATQTGFTLRRLPTPAALAFEALGLNRLFPSNPVNRRYRCLDVTLDGNEPSLVEQPPGAFLCFRRDLWRRLGGFDESFSPVWFEDVDFCKRALEYGAIRFLPQVIARHQGGASISRMDWSSRELCWYASLLRYASKHFSPSKFRQVCGAVVLSSAIRLAPGVVQRRTLKPFSVYAKTAGLAASCFVFGRMPGANRLSYQQANTMRSHVKSSAE